MNQTGLIKQGWLRAIIGLPVCFLFVRLTEGLPRFLLTTFQIPLYDPLHSRLITTTNNLIFLTLALYLLRRFVDRESFVSLGFALKGRLRDVALSVAAALGIMGVAFGLLRLLGYVTITSFNPNLTALIGWGIYLMLASALEELPMRGYMLNNLMASMNRYLAAGIIALIFGLIHGLGDTVSVMGLINTTLLGLIVGLYYVRAKNLYVPIVFHAAWNYFQGIVFGFKVSGARFDYALLKIDLSGSDLLTGGAYGLEGSIILTCVSVAVIVAYEMLSRKQEQSVQA